MPKPRTRTLDDIREYQLMYYRKNNFKVYCEVCDKHINHSRFIHHRFTNKHLRLLKEENAEPKPRKVRSDKGIPKKPKPPKTEFTPKPIILIC